MRAGGKVVVFSLVVLMGLGLFGLESGWWGEADSLDTKDPGAGGKPSATSLSPKSEEGEKGVAGSRVLRKATPSSVSRLRVRILGKDLGKKGEKPAGKVYWTTSPKAPVASSMMAPEHGFPLAKKGEFQRSLEGETVLEIPAGHWTWVRVFTVVEKKACSGYRLFPPFSGEKEFLFIPKPESRGVHVFLCRKDLETPVPHAPIRVFWMGTKTGGNWKLVRTVKTDGNGYVRVSQLQPGRFLLLGPGAKRDESLPYVQRFLLPDFAPMTEIPLSLVAHEKRFALVVEVHAGIEKGPHRAPKLFLKRRSDFMGELFPMKGVLAPGTQKVRFLVPLGSYEVGVLPLGRVAIPREQRNLEFRSPGQKFSLSAMERKKRTTVVLRGIGSRDFPVSVFPLPPGPVFDDEIALMFLGPYRWNLAEQWIPTPSGTFDCIVSGRTQSWLSRRPVAFGGDRVEIGLEPATQVQVNWKGVPWVVGKGASLEVRTEKRRFRRVFSRRLVPDGGRMEPSFVANLVVDRGRVSLVCRAFQTDKVLWRRSLELRGVRKVLEVVGRQPQ
ncbi:MAG TPA: hypothetical protein ENK02_13975 [Planctomycetes bacterium]|nr:hypothetical protein [Planctomycetota bacterium]